MVISFIFQICQKKYYFDLDLDLKVKIFLQRAQILSDFIFEYERLTFLTLGNAIKSLIINFHHIIETHRNITSWTLLYYRSRLHHLKHA